MLFCPRPRGLFFFCIAPKKNQKKGAPIRLWRTPWQTPSLYGLQPLGMARPYGIQGITFSPFEGGRGDETFNQHFGRFIPLTPFKGGMLLRGVSHGLRAAEGNGLCCYRSYASSYWREAPASSYWREAPASCLVPPGGSASTPSTVHRPPSPVHLPPSTVPSSTVHHPGL